MAEFRTEMWDYWQHARRHYFNLVTGLVLAALAFVSSATGLIVPAWVFWILAIGFLVAAQFRTYRDVKRDLDHIKDKIDADEGRHKRLQESRVLSGETFNVWELLVPNAKPMVENREFTDCIIRGPALIAPQIGCKFEDSTAGIGPVESVLYEMTPGPRQGVIALVRCKFLRCRFEGIGWYGDKAMLDTLRAMPVF
jgi:hypothetical protein